MVAGRFDDPPTPGGRVLSLQGALPRDGLAGFSGHPNSTLLSTNPIVLWHSTAGQTIPWAPPFRATRPPYVGSSRATIREYRQLQQPSVSTGSHRSMVGSRYASWSPLAGNGPFRTLENSVGS